MLLHVDPCALAFIRDPLWSGSLTRSSRGGLHFYGPVYGERLRQVLLGHQRQRMCLLQRQNDSPRHFGGRSKFDVGLVIEVVAIPRKILWQAGCGKDNLRVHVDGLHTEAEALPLEPSQRGVHALKLRQWHAVLLSGPLLIPPTVEQKGHVWIFNLLQQACRWGKLNVLQASEIPHRELPEQVYPMVPLHG